MARKIVITSGKGGVGKTTICANLGAKLASLGFRVVLVDVDFGLNNLDVVMGVENKVLYDLVDAVNGKCRVKQALIQDERYSSLFMLPSSHYLRKNNVTADDVKMVVDYLDGSFDYIFIDCPAGVDDGFHKAVYPADEAIVVATPHISSVRDADKVVSLLVNYSNITNVSLIINRVRGDMLISGEIMEIDDIVDALGIKLLGVIPEDDAISIVSSTGDFVEKSIASRSLALISENLHNGSKKIYDCTFSYRGFLGALKRIIKKRV